MNNHPGSPPKPAGAFWVRIFRVRGIGVHVDPTILLTLACVVLLAGGSLILLAILLGCALVHEFGHALTARRCGLVVTGIYLHVVALAHVQRGHPRDTFLVSLAGPLANVLLGVLLLAMFRPGVSLPGADVMDWIADPVRAAIGCNLLMGTVNLVPLMPADGGHALQALVRMRSGPAIAHAVSAIVNTMGGMTFMVMSVQGESCLGSDLLFVLGIAVCFFGWRETRAAIRRGTS